MPAQVIPFRKPKLYACRNCNQPFLPRDNGDGYCSYGCGQEHQPKYRAATLRGERDPVEEK